MQTIQLTNQQKLNAIKVLEADILSRFRLAKSTETKLSGQSRLALEEAKEKLTRFMTVLQELESFFARVSELNGEKDDD